MLAALTALLLTTSPAHAADSTGATGTITSISFYASGTTFGGYAHVTVAIGGTSYSSGGTGCTGVTELSAAQLLRLGRAQQAGASVTPFYTTVGSYRCLVGFTSTP